MKIICIDAGHGGSDPGAVGHGLREKDVTLNVALELGKKLQNQGFKVVYTRTNDKFVGLTERANIANRNNANLFVSIHCNAAVNQNAYGYETFHFPNASGGRRAATLVQSCITENKSLYQHGLNHVNRGVKTAYFTVLQNTNMQAILTELAFITNATDNNILRTRQAEYADALFKAICKYFNVSVTSKVEEPEQPHWAKKHFLSLNSKGLKIHEERYEDYIKRAEIYALLDRITDLK